MESILDKGLYLTTALKSTIGLLSHGTAKVFSLLFCGNHDGLKLSDLEAEEQVMFLLMYVFILQKDKIISVLIHLKS